MQPLAVQIVDIIPILLNVERYPASPQQQPNDSIPAPTLHFAFEVGKIDEQHCQVVFGVDITIAADIPIAHIQSKVAGTFILAFFPEAPEAFQELYQSSIVDILLPFLRESVLELCVRFRLPPVLLPNQLREAEDISPTEEPTPVKRRRVRTKQSM